MRQEKGLEPELLLPRARHAANDLPHTARLIAEPFPQMRTHVVGKRNILRAIEAAAAAGRSGITFVGFDAVADAVAALRTRGEVVGPLHLLGVSYGAATAIFSARTA